jgi:hypothetical protein
MTLAHGPASAGRSQCKRRLDSISRGFAEYRFLEAEPDRLLDMERDRIDLLPQFGAGIMKDTVRLPMKNSPVLNQILDESYRARWANNERIGRLANPNMRVCMQRADGRVI